MSMNFLFCPRTWSDKVSIFESNISLMFHDFVMLTILYKFLAFYLQNELHGMWDSTEWLFYVLCRPTELDSWIFFV